MRCPPTLLLSRVVESIGNMIKKLRWHRSGLRAFPARIQLEATLDKVNTLCDGISESCLLQQVLDGFGCFFFFSSGWMDSDGQLKITAFLLYDRSFLFSFLLLQHVFSYFFSVVIYNCRISFSLSPNLDDYDF